MAILAYENMVLTPISDMQIGHKKLDVFGSAMKPLFRTSDIADVLGIKDQTQMIRDLDDDDKGLLKVQTTGGIQKVSFITEFGLYDVLFVSRKTVAKDFKRKVKAALFVLRVTGKITKEDIEKVNSTGMVLPDNNKNEGVTQRGMYDVQHPFERGTYDIQPPSVKQLRAEFEVIRQAKNLLPLSDKEVRRMVNSVVDRYGMASRLAE